MNNWIDQKCLHNNIETVTSLLPHKKTNTENFCVAEIVCQFSEFFYTITAALLSKTSITLQR